MSVDTLSSAELDVRDAFLILLGTRFYQVSETSSEHFIVGDIIEHAIWNDQGLIISFDGRVTRTIGPVSLRFDDWSQSITVTSAGEEPAQLAVLSPTRQLGPPTTYPLRSALHRAAIINYREWAVNVRPGALRDLFVGQAPIADVTFERLVGGDVVNFVLEDGSVVRLKIAAALSDPQVEITLGGNPLYPPARPRP